MRIRHILRSSGNSETDYNLSFSCYYYVVLTERHPDDFSRYVGVLKALDSEKLLIGEYTIWIRFPDLKNLTQIVLTRPRNSQEELLVYDTRRKIMILQEMMNTELSLPQKNKRYIYLKSHYIAEVRIESEPVLILGSSSISHAPEEERANTDHVFRFIHSTTGSKLSFDDVGFSQKTKAFLESAGYTYMHDVYANLYRIQRHPRITPDKYDEIIAKLRACEYDLSKYNLALPPRKQ